MYDLYAAGLFDGEGSVFLNANGKSKSGTHYVLRCTLTLSTHHVLTELQSKYGGSITHRPQIGKLSTRPFWQWSITGKNARAFLHRMIPLLIIKKAEAEAALYWNGQDGAAMQEHMRALRRQG